ncbi:MAG TPA: aminotransferase class IV [Flavipsychrobacter sp.]|nr:aminotransferase class IV [Flavipsychrobacter sp.]
MPFVNLNGTFYAHDALPVTSANSALRYGWGLFETLLVSDGQIQLAAYHWERLFEGMKKMRLKVSRHFDPMYLTREIERTFKKNDLERLCRVRFQVFTDMDGVFADAHQPVHYLIECFSLEKAAMQWNENGWVCGIAQGVKKSNDEFANLKTCNVLPYIVAAREAKDQKWNDAFILNTDGNIVESAIANIFWVKGDKLFTPPLSEGCVAGVMRRHIIEVCTHRAIPFEESILNLQGLMEADEVFLSNAIRKVKWIKGFESVIYGNELTFFLSKNLF